MTVQPIVDYDDMTEEERVAHEKKENREIKSYSRRLKRAMLNKTTKNEISDEFPDLDGSNKQTYAIVAVLDSLDRDVQESEKLIANKETNNNAGALVTTIYEGIVARLGDPSAAMATGERHIRDLGATGRLKPENTATAQHMHKGNDVIVFEDVFVDSNNKKKPD